MNIEKAKRNKTMSMKKLSLIGTGLVLILSTVLMIDSLTESDFSGRTSRYLSERKISKAESAKGALEWRRRRWMNPETQEIDNKAVFAAREKSQQLMNKKSHSRSAVTTDDWFELGPHNHGGRTRALLVDNRNHSKIYAAGVAGGLFISSDGGKSWQRENDLPGFLTVSAICQAPDGTVYIGTGEGHYFYSSTGSGGLPGDGIYKGVVSGDTLVWEHLTETSANGSTTGTWAGIYELHAHPTKSNVIYAANFGGLYTSFTSGDTWDRADGIPATDILDIDVVQNGSQVQVHATSSSNYYRSEDEGQTFIESTDNEGFPTIGIRAEIRVAPSDPNYLYLSNADNQGFLEGYYQSTDAGLTWSVITKGGSDFFEPFGTGQGDFDNIVGISNDNPEEVFFGGVELWKWSREEGLNMVASTQEALDGRWYVHADNHAIENHPTDSNIFYFGNDGGVFATYNRGRWYTHLNNGYRTMQCYDATVGPYGEVIAGFQDNGTHIIDIPNKDSAEVLLNSEHVSGGDGGKVEWSYINPNAIFGASQLGNIRRSSNKGESFNSFFDDNAAPNPDLVGTDYSFASFVTPYRLWESVGEQVIDTIIRQVLPSNAMLDSLEDNQDPRMDTIIDTVQHANMFFAGLNSGLWMTKDALNFSVAPVWYKLSSIPGSPEVVEVSADGETVWVGSTSGIYRVTNFKDKIYGYRYNGEVVLNTNEQNDTSYSINNAAFIADSVGITMETFNVASRQVTGISIDENDPNHVVFTFGGYGGSAGRIYETTNANDSVPTFTDISGDIDNWPVYDAQIDVEDGSRVFVGTEFGVYQANSTNGSSTDWSFVGPSNVAVFSLDQVSISDSINELSKTGSDHSGAILVAATHARGVWATNYDLCDIYDVDCQTALNIEESSVVLNSSVQIYPNPIVSDANINLTIMDRADVNIRVYNLSGSLVKSYDYANQAKGHQFYSINLENEQNGIYLVHTIVNGVVYKNKLVKLN